MEAAWKHQKEGDGSSAGAADPRIACNEPESATDGSSLLAHGMQEVVGSSPTSSTSKVPANAGLSLLADYRLAVPARYPLDHGG